MRIMRLFVHNNNLVSVLAVWYTGVVVSTCCAAQYQDNCSLTVPPQKKRVSNYAWKKEKKMLRGWNKNILIKGKKKREKHTKRLCRSTGRKKIYIHIYSLLLISERYLVKFWEAWPHYAYQLFYHLPLSHLLLLRVTSYDMEYKTADS